jgi:hypothetical protein
MTNVMKTLLLNPASFENFDGGASSRWPATREIESYWYPVWLRRAQAEIGAARSAPVTATGPGRAVNGVGVALARRIPAANPSLCCAKNVIANH